MAPPSVLAAPALLLMAVACGLCAGGNYYNQALLHSIALHFGVDQAAAGLSVTVAQVAYAVGLLCITPLGDKLERRRMAVVLMLLAAVGHALVGWSGSFAMFMLGTLVAGLFSVAAQVLVPMAAALAAPGHARGAMWAWCSAACWWASCCRAAWPVACPPWAAGAWCTRSRPWPWP